MSLFRINSTVDKNCRLHSNANLVPFFFFILLITVLPENIIVIQNLQTENGKACPSFIVAEITVRADRN